MPIDASIPLQATPPSFEGALKPISSLLGLQAQQQQLQQGQQAIQSNQQTIDSNAIDLHEKQAMQQLLQDPKQFQDETGNFDFNKLVPAVMSVAPVNGPKYIQGIFSTQQQATEAKRSVNQLDAETRVQVGQFITSMAGQDPLTINEGLKSLKAKYPNLTPAVDFFGKYVIGPAAQTGDPKRLSDTMWRIGRSVVDPATQQGMATPGGIAVSNNQQSSVVSTKPGTDVPQGAAIPGTAQQMQLPPTTPTVGPNNQPGYVGTIPAPLRNNNPGALMPGGKLATFGSMEEGLRALDQNLQSYGKSGVDTLAGVISKWAPPGQNNTAAYIQDVSQRLGIKPDQKIDLSNPAVRQALSTGIMLHENGPAAFAQASTPSGFVPSGPVPGANESKGGTIETVNQHWKQINDQAANAPLIQGLLGNIKSLAPGAITGQEAGRKAYLNGLLNALHLGSQATGDVQRDTDLLEKNIAQLGLNTPASTDAARTLVAAARPHSTMSAAAIEEAAAQLGGQIQANLSVRNALTSAKSIADRTGDPTAYIQMRQHLEQIADPRAWEFQSLSPQGRADMLKKLTPEDRAQLRENIKALESEGLLK